MNVATRLAVIACAAFGAWQVNAEQATQDAAPDTGKAQEIFQSVCKNCHGSKGQGMASFPKLVGNSQDYITDRMRIYHAGERVGPTSALMTPHAAKLSDAEITDLAVYIATELE